MIMATCRVDWLNDPHGHAMVVSSNGSKNMTNHQVSMFGGKGKTSLKK